MVYILTDHYEEDEKSICISDGLNYAIDVDYNEEDEMVSFSLPDQIWITLNEAKLIANKILEWCDG